MSASPPNQRLKLTDLTERELNAHAEETKIKSIHARGVRCGEFSLPQLSRVPLAGTKESMSVIEEFGKSIIAWVIIVLMALFSIFAVPATLLGLPDVWRSNHSGVEIVYVILFPVFTLLSYWLSRTFEYQYASFFRFFFYIMGSTSALTAIVLIVIHARGILGNGFDVGRLLIIFFSCLYVSLIIVGICIRSESEFQACKTIRGWFIQE